MSPVVKMELKQAEVAVLISQQAAGALETVTAGRQAAGNVATVEFQEGVELDAMAKDPFIWTKLPIFRQVALDVHPPADGMAVQTVGLVKVFAVMPPFTTRLSAGFVVPIPTFPPVTVSTSVSCFTALLA